MFFFVSVSILWYIFCWCFDALISLFCRFFNVFDIILAVFNTFTSYLSVFQCAETTFVVVCFKGQEEPVTMDSVIFDAPSDFIPVHLRGGFIIPTQDPANTTVIRLKINVHTSLMYKEAIKTLMLTTTCRYLCTKMLAKLVIFGLCLYSPCPIQKNSLHTASNYIQEYLYI